MQFHLNHTPEKPGFEINHSHSIFLLGSCFAENISALLKEHQFKTYANPNGILFNPLSMATCLDVLLENKPADETYLLQRNSIFLSYLHHSSVHATDKTALLQKINETNNAALSFLKEADFLILTFGSAVVYRHVQLNRVVANCHKQPGAAFEKRLLAPEEIIGAYTKVVGRLKQLNPKLKIIFTVSPVKYLKDGLVQNNLSKAILTFSVHELIKNNPGCFYFPAYELVTDDLRDYRFYKKDLAHPNEQAIEYVWQKFSDTCFSTATKSLDDKIHRLHLALQHRSITADALETAQLNDFIARQKEEIRKSGLG